jgi:hypothetical protein
MSAYIRDLQRMVAEKEAARKAARAEEARAAADAARERLSPLDERLARLLATIPVDTLRTGVPLISLQRALKGRQGRNCSSSELADCLRRAGLARFRNWSKGKDGFRAVWRLNA